MNRRVVFDTSTLVSAALRPTSIPDQALSKAFSAYELCGSLETVRELERILASTKFDRYLARSARNEFLELLRRQLRIFAVTDADMNNLIPRCRDAKDDPFLAVATVSEATILVSSDEDLLCLHPWNGVDILRPAEFMVR